MSSVALAAIRKNNREVVLSTYRSLWRATGIAFQGDQQTLESSRAFARQSFDSGRGLAAGSVEAEQAVQHAQGVAQILRENVVQGKKGGDERFKLNIHEHTERGDNESVKQFKGTGKSFADLKCCSS